jgi:hypothetical protein
MVCSIGFLGQLKFAFEADSLALRLPLVGRPFPGRRRCSINRFAVINRSPRRSGQGRNDEIPC